MNKQYPTVNVYACSDPKSSAIHKQQDTKDAYKVNRIPWVYAHMACEHYIDEVQHANKWEWSAPDLITMDKTLDDLKPNGVFHARLYDRDCILILSKEKVSANSSLDDGFKESWWARGGSGDIPDLHKAFTYSGMIKALQRGDTHIRYDNPDMIDWIRKKDKLAKKEFTGAEREQHIYFYDSDDPELTKEQKSLHTKYTTWRKQYDKDNPQPVWYLNIEIVDVLLGKHKLPEDHGATYAIKEVSKRVKGILCAPHELDLGLGYLDGDFAEPIDLSNLEICKHLSTLDADKPWN